MFVTELLKLYNPNLYGYSTGTGDRDSDKAVFNVGQPGNEARYDTEYAPHIRLNGIL